MREFDLISIVIFMISSIDQIKTSILRCEQESVQIVDICLARSSICDGIIDCRHAIDEQCTDKNPLIICSSDEYHCPWTHRCIPKSWLCNGINDCHDWYSSDESNCTNHELCSSTDEFRCQSMDQCIPFTSKCDGIEDCLDGSDESSSVCHIPHQCSNAQFQCQSSGLCIPLDNQCDTISQCHDRSDELLCTCPIEDDLRNKFFLPCEFTDQCLPKTIECDRVRHCQTQWNDDSPCSSDLLIIDRPCSNNRTCPEENQFCQESPSNRCVCQLGYRMNGMTGKCEDIDECRERVTCEQFCINIPGSYRCACETNYHLNVDKHTCTRRQAKIDTVSMMGLLNDGIYRWKFNRDNELEEHRLILSVKNIYSIAYDPVENDLYFAECNQFDRPCLKTSGIFRLRLNDTQSRKELIISTRDYTLIQSMAIDWLHRSIYFINRRLQTIDVCRLNGSFCYVLLHQISTDALPQRLVLYPEKGYLFYITIIKSQAQHVMRLGLDGKNLQVIFIWKIEEDFDEEILLQPRLTIDPINHHLYFYNGLNKIFILNINGDVLHIQYEISSRFHAFQVYADKIYKAFSNVSEIGESEFRINAKYATGSALQTSLHQRRNSSWTYPHLYQRRYPLDLIDFIIVEKRIVVPDQQCDRCDHLCFSDSFDQTKVTCGCAQYHHLAADGHSCEAVCAEAQLDGFFHCAKSGKCLPFYQRCDGTNDCLFGEDEDNCPGTCPSASPISCLYSPQCLRLDDLCNQQVDCLHGEDENDLVCGHYCEWPSATHCRSSEKFSNLCTETEFYCDGKCVSIDHRCDGQPYCYDGADEFVNCANVTCPVGYFKCLPSGKCIPWEHVCDGVDDCPLNDRLNATAADETSIACSKNCDAADLFRCRHHQLCINRTYVCDGHPDCPDASDEEHCHDDRQEHVPFLSIHEDFTCMYGYRCHRQRSIDDDQLPLCISLHQLCDGIHQCPLGDDEHPRRCHQNCTDCDSTRSYCELINYMPLCQCKVGYVPLANGSCIEDGKIELCPHTSLSTARTSNCRCDQGYEMVRGTVPTCVVKTNETFQVMLYPRATFYLNQSGTILSPIHPSHHAIDVAFVPSTDRSWYLFYTEQRTGRAFLWRQSFSTTQKSSQNATQIWFAPSLHFSSFTIDWIHRLLYVLYTDPLSSSNGIEILYAKTADYYPLISVNRLTFSKIKTIASIHVHPGQGYLYIGAYSDAQHSYVYRSYLDGSHLEIFLTLSYPVLSMTLDYHHPRLYVLLSNGQIESYAIDDSQPWKRLLHQFTDVRPYSISLHDDHLIVMAFNSTDSTYEEIWLDKFGRTRMVQHRQLKSPMFVRYIHSWTYPIGDRSMCTSVSCPLGEICIPTPWKEPVCITPGGQRCGAICHDRGICSNGQCLCSNRTYVSPNCTMCRVTETIRAGCFDTSPSNCTCYLSRSFTRQTPYLCTTLNKNGDEIEIPCDRIISPVRADQCSSQLFDEQRCEGLRYALMFHPTTQSCICREMMTKKSICFNGGLLIINDLNNATTCSCPFPFTGAQCQTNDSCSPGFAGSFCQTRSGLSWPWWMIISVTVALLFLLGTSMIRYSIKRIRLKYLFAHHRLHEQISLNLNAASDAPLLENYYCNDNELFNAEMIDSTDTM